MKEAKSYSDYQLPIRAWLLSITIIYIVIVNLDVYIRFNR